MQYKPQRGDIQITFLEGIYYIWEYQFPAFVLVNSTRSVETIADGDEQYERVASSNSSNLYCGYYRLKKEVRNAI